VNWSSENCAQLIRVPKPVGITPRIEIRSADACCNPYITFKLILAAGIEGIQSNDCSLFESAMHSGENCDLFQPLPSTLEEAAAIAESSEFVKRTLSADIRSSVFAQLRQQISDYEKAEDKDRFEEISYFKFV
ncbi:MAG TPA: glutamine synthetase, partial [Ruminococcus sp.]|nr:glutamine synthetase [Ruminococcus sp.]